MAKAGEYKVMENKGIPECVVVKEPGNGREASPMGQNLCPTAMGHGRLGVPYVVQGCFKVPRHKKKPSLEVLVEGPC